MAASGVKAKSEMFKRPLKLGERFAELWGVAFSMSTSIISSSKLNS
jgi:hypothetical protein